MALLALPTSSAAPLCPWGASSSDCPLALLIHGITSSPPSCAAPGPAWVSRSWLGLNHNTGAAGPEEEPVWVWVSGLPPCVET